MNAMAQAPVADFSATPTAGCGPLIVHFTDQSTNKPVFWSWDFGNGQVSSIQNPSVTYASPGSYNVRLIARNASGASVAEKDAYITVYPYPNPQFTSNLNVACTPANVQFQDESSPGQGSITSWAWTFGDGSTSTQQNPAHTYSQTGYFDITLTVTNSGGCSNKATISRDVRVINGIQPNFVFNQSSTSCSAPFAGQLLNQSAGPGNLTYNWTIGNGATPSSSADTSPIVTFPNSGQYNVNLTVASNLGCVATLQQTLNLANGTATINGPTTVCANTPVTFSDGNNPAPPYIAWTFSNGSTSNSSSATTTFPAIGSYTVKLLNKYAACADSTTETINSIGPPVPNFTATPTGACKPPLTVQFTDASTSNPPGNVTGWSWDFGDGQTSTAQNPQHTYTTAGTFNVTLTAMGPGGCSNSVTKNAFVSIQAPTVTVAGTLGACIASTPTFSEIQPVANVNAPDGVQGYLWSAPGSNEKSSTLAAPSFTYPTTGSYSVSVTVTTNGGCTATGSATVVIGTPLVPQFTTSPNPPTVCGNTPITFTSNTTPIPQTWTWTFGDHTNYQVNGSPTATYQYGYFGPHVVTLTVYNSGCRQAASETVNVNPPFARFVFALANANCSNKSQIQFTDSSYIANTPAGLGTYGPITWSWDFNDPASGPNNTSNLENPVHTFPPPTGTPVTYNVTLTVTQGFGPSPCSSTITLPVTIGDITASFTPIPTACRNAPVTFTSTSTPSALISGYSWQVDALPATTPSASTTFQTTFTPNGTHSVTLIAYDLNNCASLPATNSITISGPHAKFALPATGGACKNGPANFTDQTTPDPNTTSITAWSWNFGDGAVSGAQNPQHVYSDTGSYTVLLTAKDNAQCIDTSSQQILITGPTANFFPPDSFYCPGALETFIDSSRGYGLQETWNFGDASPNSTIGAHTFGTNGTYNVSLAVTDQNGCTSSVTTKPIRIQTPIAAFNSYDTTGICLPLETIFAAHGQYYDSLYWKFGDGTTSTLDSTAHFYNAFGLDTAKLFLQGPGGCLDSASYRVRITNPNTTSMVFGPPLSACDSLPVQFTLGPPPYTSFTTVFGDGVMDSSQNNTLAHTYHNPGFYAPYLVLTDETGCIVNYGTGIGVTVLGATPFFNVNKHAFCDNGIVNFTDFTISNDGFASETYTFGDGSPNQSTTGGTGGFDVSNDYDKLGLWTATLQVVTQHGCAETYSDTIHIYQTPHPAITIPPITCAGPIQFQGSLNPPETDSITWSWNFGNGETSDLQSPTVPMAPGTYTLRLEASIPFGCTDSASSPVTIHPGPDIKGPNELTVPLGIPVTIPFIYSPDAVSYQWTPTANLSCTDCANPVATVLLATTYTVTVTDANSCTASDTILIKTVCNDKNYWFPNTFSPNGDGVNDYFYPRGTSLYNIQSLTIFNRWGQQVFQRMDFPANQQNMGWDGTFGGKPAPADAYVYIAQVICENAQVITISGNVTLIR
jgi:gliding motility-associated-like protein